MKPGGGTVDSRVLRDPDIDLMLRVRADEPEAFEELVQRCRPRLLGFLTPQAVKSLLWRARANLRETLQSYLSNSNGSAAEEGHPRADCACRC